MQRRTLLRAAMALPAMAFATSASAQDVLAAARREGRATWYTSLIGDVGARPLAAAFEAKYPGVKVDLVAGTNDDLVLKLLAEGRAGRMNADVSHGGSAVIPARKAGLVEPYASPEAALAPMTFNHHAAISRAAGAPVRWLGLTPVVINLDALFLLKGAPHPNAGKLFIDFLLSSDGQRIFRDAGYIPAAPGIIAKLPGLTPEAGHFDPVVITPEMVDRNMGAWLTTTKSLFG